MIEGTFEVENTVQPISDDFSSDGTLDEFARIDHQHPLSPSLRTAIFGSAGTSASIYNNNSPLRRNLLHNGEMKICQRYGPSAIIGASVASTYYTDRWSYAPPGIAGCTVYPNWPNVFEDFTLFLIAQAALKAVMAAGDASSINQTIEGRNLQHLRWGSAQALPLVYSFVAQATVAQNIVIEFFNNSSATGISKVVNITPGFKRYFVTIPGNTITAFINNNTPQLTIVHWLAAGSNYASTVLNSIWGTYAVTGRATGVGNLYAIAGTQFWITGCQLEIGTTPTPFEHQQTGDILLDCLRYFERIDSSLSATSDFGAGFCFSGTQAHVTIPFKVIKRAAPIIALSAANTFGVYSAAGGPIACTGIALHNANQFQVAINATVAGGLVAGNSTVLISNGVTTTTIDSSAEI